MSTVPDRNSAPPSLTELIGGIGSDMHDLVVAHAAQMHEEVQTEFHRARTAELWLGAGLIGVGLGLAGIWISVAMLLVEAAGWPVWAAAALIGVVTLIGGFAITWVARKKAAEVKLVPTRSLKAIQESLTCLVNPAT